MGKLPSAVTGKLSSVVMGKLSLAVTGKLSSAVMGKLSSFVSGQLINGRNEHIAPAFQQMAPTDILGRDRNNGR